MIAASIPMIRPLYRRYFGRNRSPSSPQQLGLSARPKPRVFRSMRGWTTTDGTTSTSSPTITANTNTTPFTKTTATARMTGTGTTTTGVGDGAMMSFGLGTTHAHTGNSSEVWLEQQRQEEGGEEEDRGFPSRLGVEGERERGGEDTISLPERAVLPIGTRPGGGYGRERAHSLTM